MGGLAVVAWGAQVELLPAVGEPRDARSRARRELLARESPDFDSHRAVVDLPTKEVLKLRGALEADVTYEQHVGLRCALEASLRAAAADWQQVLEAARALERLRGYDLAAQHYRESARLSNALRDEALTSAAICDRLADAVAIGFDLRDPLAEASGPLPLDATRIRADLDEREDVEVGPAVQRPAEPPGAHEELDADANPLLSRTALRSPPADKLPRPGPQRAQNDGIHTRVARCRAAHPWDGTWLCMQIWRRRRHRRSELAIGAEAERLHARQRRAGGAREAPRAGRRSAARARARRGRAPP